MAEQVIREYILKTDQFKAAINSVQKEFADTAKDADKATNTAEKGFKEGTVAAKQMDKAVNQTNAGLKNTQVQAQKVDSQFTKLTASVKSLGAAVGLALGAQEIIRFTKGAIDAANDLGETTSKAGELFGASLNELEKWAAGAAQSIGQSQKQALDGASTFAIFGRAAGKSGSDLVEFSTGLTELASDLASFNNTTPEDAIQAIGAALRGEAEPIRRYGVLLDDATLKQEALELGIISTTKQALTPQQKVLAAQAAIFKQTSAAQGDFARTGDDLANMQRKLAAEFENAKAILGQSLLPTVLTVAKAFNNLGAENFVKIIKTIAVAGITFVTVTAATKAATLASAAYRAVSIALAGAKALLTGNTLRAAAAQRALGLAFASTPWGLVITAITTAAGALLFFRDNTDEAADSQGELANQIDLANEALKEQKALLSDTENILGQVLSGQINLSKVSITELESALSDLDDRLKSITVEDFMISLNTEITPEELKKQAEERYKIEIESLRKTEAIIKKEIALKKAKNKTINDDELTALQRLQAELKAINDRIADTVLKGGIVSQKDVTRAAELEKILRELPLLINAAKTGVPDIVPDLGLSEDDLKALEANLQRGTEIRNEAAERDLQNANDYLERKFNAELDYNLEREQLELDYQRFLQQQRESQINGAFAVADGVLSAFSSMFSALAEDNEEFAEFQKALAILDVSLKAAQAISAATASAASGDPYTVAIRIAAAVAAVGAAIGTIVQTVKSAQVPTAPAFAKGTEFVQRGKNKPGIDTIPAYLNEGEAVIPTDKNKQYPGLAKAWIGGKLESYVNNVMLAPKLAEIERKAEERLLSKVLSVNTEKYDDMRLYMAATEGNMYLSALLKETKRKRKKRTL